MAVVVGLDAVALALLGPGAYSVDSYRFGRRVGRSLPATLDGGNPFPTLIERVLHSKVRCHWPDLEIVLLRAKRSTGGRTHGKLGFGIGGRCFYGRRAGHGLL